MGSMPKTKKKNIPKSIHEMSQEMLQETLKKKKECNAKALFTVEKLCETNVDEEWFLDNLQFINQCHFDDATIERAITKLCGYPLCDQKLDKVPTQQYHISTRYNKVYDITERKNFCSSTCYKSAMYVKNQLFTSPLWFRDQEKIPKYKILKTAKSSMGEEVVFYPDKIKPEPDDIKKTKSLNKNVDINKSISEIEVKCENLKLDDCEKVVPDEVKNTVVENREICGNKPTEDNFCEEVNSVKKEEDEELKQCLVKNTESENNIETISSENKVENISTENKIENTNTANKTENISNKSKTDNMNNENKILEDSKDLKLEKTQKIKTKVKVKEEPVDIVSKIEKYIFEWFSLDTLFYLYGEEKLKEKFQDEAVKIKEILNSKLSTAGYNDKIEKIIKLYGLLDNDLLSKSEIKTNLKPLPDYSVLKEEGKTLEIKVRAFYHGQLEVKPAQKEEKKEEESKETESDPIYLPLIDAHAQTALRRKIVLDKLNRVLPELIRVFSSDYVLNMNEVRNLVSTFSLAAHNITFKPREWYLVGAIIIKLLSLKDKQLELLINSKSSESQIKLILMSYQLESNFLDDFLVRLTDSTNIMKKINGYL